jgi:hypothetical protein
LFIGDELTFKVKELQLDQTVLSIVGSLQGIEKHSQIALLGREEEYGGSMEESKSKKALSTPAKDVKAEKKEKVEEKKEEKSKKRKREDDEVDEEIKAEHTSKKSRKEKA